MLNCQTCGVAPVSINSPKGFFLECPKCRQKSGPSWADYRAAVEDWDRAQDHGLPAGLETMIDRRLGKLGFGL